MKKALFVLLALGLGATFSVASQYESLIKDIGAAGAAGGAALGIGWIHFIFWGKIMAFLLPVILILGYYAMKMEQKDRGVWKLIGFGLASLVVGALFVVGFASVEQNTYTKDGCSGAVAKAYLQDAVQTALSGGTHQFGTQIRGTGCFE